MFTGLIEAVCAVKLVSPGAGGIELTVELGAWVEGVKVSDSIAVNGACLTIAKLNGSSATFDVSGETLSKSTLGKLRPGSQVNIERAIKADGRFGGHFVQGHVDGTAIIKAIEKKGKFWDFVFSAPAELLDMMVVKGSVAVDGISLTVASMNENSFTAAIIPKTWENTTSGKAKIGDEVNIENDIIIKTVKSNLEKMLSKSQPLTLEKLEQSGFLA
ncbi:MAG: riboflavin synthase [Sedimentisphaerales bacterium]|nr:riboflavin synthase [Sedimentisphaerales bacterium]